MKANNKKNANNNTVPGHAVTPSLSNLVYKLVVQGADFVLRLNITLLLIAYDTALKFAGRLLSPLEPIAAEVRKVPKKDITVEGIFYQFMRLQFLMALYVWPFFLRFLTFVALPMIRVKDWMVRYVHEDGQQPWKTTDGGATTVLKDK